MEINLQAEGRQAVLRLSGELDHHGARGLLERLDRELDVVLPMLLVVDFSGVTFMDSSGIAVVIRLQRRMRQLGGSVKLINLSSQAYKVLAAAGIHKLVTMQKRED